MGKRANVDIDTVEREYLAGASTHELADKYGVYHSTISKWMKKRGHVRGKGQYSGYGKVVAKKRAKVRVEFEQWLADNYGGEFDCIDYLNKNTPCKLRCNKCGNEFTRWHDKRHTIQCPCCHEDELNAKRELRAKQQEAERANNERARAEELAKDKICQSCGSVFHSEFKTQLYCNDTCSRRAKRHDDKKRAMKHGVEYEPGITLEKLIERDHNTCQICGMPCDENDLRWGYSGPLHPTKDHIIAIANGGPHVWSNMQLAHHICNSIKRDLFDDEMTEEVIAYAKEQAAAYKCA